MIQSCKEGFYTLIQLSGSRLDQDSGPALKPFIQCLADQGEKYLVLDLGNVDYLDSSGLSAILVVNRICLESGGSLAIINPKAPVHNLFEMANLGEILSIRKNLSEAIRIDFPESAWVQELVRCLEKSPVLSFRFPQNRYFCQSLFLDQALGGWKLIMKRFIKLLT